MWGLGMGRAWGILGLELAGVWVLGGARGGRRGPVWHRNLTTPT